MLFPSLSGPMPVGCERSADSYSIPAARATGTTARRRGLRLRGGEPCGVQVSDRRVPRRSRSQCRWRSRCWRSRPPRPRGPSRRGSIRAASPPLRSPSRNPMRRARASSRFRPRATNRRPASPAEALGLRRPPGIPRSPRRRRRFRPRSGPRSRDDCSWASRRNAALLRPLRTRPDPSTLRIAGDSFRRHGRRR